MLERKMFLYSSYKRVRPELRHSRRFRESFRFDVGRKGYRKDLVIVGLIAVIERGKVVSVVHGGGFLVGLGKASL